MVFQTWAYSGAVPVATVSDLLGQEWGHESKQDRIIRPVFVSVVTEVDMTVKE